MEVSEVGVCFLARSAFFQSHTHSLSERSLNYMRLLHTASIWKVALSSSTNHPCLRHLCNSDAPADRRQALADHCSDHPGKRVVDFFQSDVNIASARAFLDRFLLKHGEMPLDVLDGKVPSRFPC